MSLAYAIKKNAASRVEAQNTYKDNVLIINNLMLSIINSRLPALHENPPDWDDLVKTYQKVKSDALNWLNDILARLLNVPDDVWNYNKIINLILCSSREQALTLIKNPSDQAALEVLKNDLSALSEQIKIVDTFISTPVTGIKYFKDKLPNIAINLDIIANKAMNDATAAQNQADAETLDILARSCLNMSSECQNIEGNLSAVLVEWEALEKDVNQVITDTRTAISHATAKDFKAILNDINDAIDEWDKAYKQAGVLHIVLKPNTG